MWYLIVSIPDLCTLTYFVWYGFIEAMNESVTWNTIGRQDRIYNEASVLTVFILMDYPIQVDTISMELSMGCQSKCKLLYGLCVCPGG